MDDDMDTELVTTTDYGLTATGGGILLPAVIADAGPKADKHFIEFLTATIRNGNTRQAYARAIGDFFAWCQRHRLTLTDIEPVHVAAYIEAIGTGLGFGSDFDHLMSSARGSCSRRVDETIYLSVLFSSRR
jgi:hypothetical protein